MDEIDFRPYARMSINGHILNIALKSFKQYEQSLELLYKLKEEGGEYYDYEGVKHFLYKRHDEIQELEHEVSEEGIKTIIFLAIYCEAYIWDLSANALGDSYTNKYIEKLDTVSKWVVVPRLITGRQLDRSKNYFAKLKSLIAWRNKLVHSKSKDVSSILNSEGEQLAKLAAPIYEQTDIKSYFVALKEMLESLSLIDPAGSHSNSLLISKLNLREE